MLIKKNSKSKDYLIQLPRQLNNRIVIDIEKWGELVTVIFNRNKPLIEWTVKDDQRLIIVDRFRVRTQDVLQKLLK